MSNRAETENERRARVRVDLAVAYYEARQYESALNELRTAISANANYSPAYNLFGLIYSELKETQRAEQAYQQGLRITPNDSELNNNYGWFLCQNGRPRESIAFFANTLRNPLYRTPAKPTANMGICSMRMNDLAAAEGYFSKALELDPGNPVAMYYLAEVYLLKPDFPRAWFVAEILSRPNDATAQVVWLGVRAARAAQQRNAELLLSDRLRRQFSDSPEAGKLARGEYDRAAN